MPLLKDRDFYGEHQDREAVGELYYGGEHPFPCAYSTMEEEEGGEVLVQYTPIVIRMRNGTEQVKFMKRIRSDGDSPWIAFTKEGPTTVSNVTDKGSETLDYNRQVLENSVADHPILTDYVMSQPGTSRFLITEDGIEVVSLAPGDELIFYNKDTGTAISLVPNERKPIMGLMVDAQCNTTVLDYSNGGYGDASTTFISTRVHRLDEGTGLDANSFPLVLGYRSLDEARAVL